MKGHFSSEQFAQWLSGERTPGGQQHARECQQCRAEIERIEQALTLFRRTGQAWAERSRIAEPEQPARPRAGRWKYVTAAAALAACLLAIALRPRAVLVRTAEQPFVSIPYVAPPAPYERTEVRRMDVPVSTLLAAGLEVHAPAIEGSVSADVIVGQDGRALAIRLVSQSVLN